MPQSPPAFVTPSALRWARESIGYELDEAADRIGVSAEKLAAAERGDAYLTLRQAEEAARRYERPLAALFVSEPPIEEPLEAQFRRLPGAPSLPWPREMRTLAKRIRGRQAAAADLYDALDEEPPWPSVAIEYTDEPEALAARARGALGITLRDQWRWRDRSGYQPLREWIDAIEALGVLVMQDGSLPVSDLRGFASIDALAPAIVVNTNDDPRARAFTAVHELGHLLRIKAGRSTGPTTEQWCNDFASAVLMPGEQFGRDLRRAGTRDLLQAVDAVALAYGVTPYAAAVRTARLQLAPRDDIDSVIEATAAATPESRSIAGHRSSCRSVSHGTKSPPCSRSRTAAIRPESAIELSSASSTAQASAATRHSISRLATSTCATTRSASGRERADATDASGSTVAPSNISWAAAAAGRPGRARPARGRGRSDSRRSRA